MEKDVAGYCKLGPREKGRKDKGRAKPQALRDARRRRSAFLEGLLKRSNGYNNRTFSQKAGRK